MKRKTISLSLILGIAIAAHTSVANDVTVWLLGILGSMLGIK